MRIFQVVFLFLIADISASYDIEHPINLPIGDVKTTFQDGHQSLLFNLDDQGVEQDQKCYPALIFHFDKHRMQSSHYFGHTSLLTGSHYMNLWSSAYKIRTRIEEDHHWIRDEGKLRHTHHAVRLGDYISQRPSLDAGLIRKLRSRGTDRDIVKSRAILHGLQTDLLHSPSLPIITPLFFTREQIETLNKRFVQLYKNVQQGSANPSEACILWNLFGSSEAGLPENLVGGMKYEFCCSGTTAWLLKAAGMSRYLGYTDDSYLTGTLPENLKSHFENLSLITYLANSLKIPEPIIRNIISDSELAARLKTTLEDLYCLKREASLGLEVRRDIFLKILTYIAEFTTSHETTDTLRLIEHNAHLRAFRARPQGVKWSTLPSSAKYFPIRKNLFCSILEEIRPNGNLHRVKIVGDHGSGKSSIAKELLRFSRYRDNYYVSWQLDCKTEDSFKASLRELIIELDEAKTYEAGRDSTKSEFANLCVFITEKLKQLKDSGKKWLLLLDNADDYSKPNNIIKRFDEMLVTSHFGKGVLLFTSTDRTDWGASTRARLYRTHNLDRLDSIEAVKLFEFYCKRKLPLLEDFLSRKIVPYPLDIALCATYLDKNRDLGLQDYTARLENIDLGYIAQKIIGYEQNPRREALLSLTLDSIIGKDANYLDLLFVVSLFEYNNIPEDILVPYVRYKDWTTSYNSLVDLLKANYLLKEIVDRKFELHPYVLDFIAEYAKAKIGQGRC